MAFVVALAEYLALLRATLLDFDPLATTNATAVTAVMTITDIVGTVTLAIRQIPITVSHYTDRTTSLVARDFHEGGHFLHHIRVNAVTTMQAIRSIPNAEYAIIMTSKLRLVLSMSSKTLISFIFMLSWVEELIVNIVNPSNTAFAILVLYIMAVIVLYALVHTITWTVRIFLKITSLIIHTPIRVMRSVTRLDSHHHPRQEAHNRDRDVTPDATTDAMFWAD